MSGARILLLGATGYTGDLTARSLVARGARPVLVGRNPGRVEALAAELGGLESAAVDVMEPDAVRAVLEPGDVLISTVGPFLKYGRPAVQAAAEVGAHYLDSTGEGQFIREVFERWGPVADRNGVSLLPAFGYDYVPGALAASLALEEAGPDATSVEIGYFTHGSTASGGTKASVVQGLFAENHTFRDGRIRSGRLGREIRTFDVAGEPRTAASTSAAEHYGLPQCYPQLRDVTVMFGYPPRLARMIAIAGAITRPISRIRPARRGLVAVLERFVRGSTGGPDAAQRAGSTMTVLADAGAADRRLSSVTLRGPDPYEVTADLLAWGAITAASGGLQATGALGPTRAFGLAAFIQGCATAGVVPEPGHSDME